MIILTFSTLFHFIVSVSEKFGSFAGFGRVSDVRPAKEPNVRRLSFYNERQHSCIRIVFISLLN